MQHWRSAQWFGFPCARSRTGLGIHHVSCATGTMPVLLECFMKNISCKHPNSKQLETVKWVWKQLPSGFLSIIYIAACWQRGRVPQPCHYFHCHYLILPLFVFAASTVSSWDEAGMEEESGLCKLRAVVSKFLLELLEWWFVERGYSNYWCCWEGIFHATSLPLNVIQSYFWHWESILRLTKGIEKETVGMWLIAPLNGLLSSLTACFAHVFGLGLTGPHIRNPLLSEFAAARNSIWLIW